MRDTFDEDSSNIQMNFSQHCNQIVNVVSIGGGGYFPQRLSLPFWYEISFGKCEADLEIALTIVIRLLNWKSLDNFSM